MHPRDIYQQFEICRKGRFNQIGGFVAKSVSPDGFPPKFLARKGWEAYTSTPKDFHLDEAPGLDTTLRSRLPEFNFPLASRGSSPVVVGKWYCPFMFIKEGTPRDQMTRSMYYKMTLEQRWEKIYAFERDSREEHGRLVDVEVEREVVKVGGREVGDVERDGRNGVVWYRGFGKEGGEEVCVGLSLEIVEKMEWEERNVGWVGGRDFERKVRVKKVEEEEEIVDGENLTRFGCYVLVERFVLRRLDGSLVLTHDFRHTHQIRTKWE